MRAYLPFEMEQIASGMPEGVPLPSKSGQGLTGPVTGDIMVVPE